MERTITITGRTGLFDIPSFLFSENEDLSIRFDFKNEIRFKRFRVVVKHGAQKYAFTLAKREAIKLPAEWLKLSEENLEFSLLLLNDKETAVIKSDYQIEPLKMEKIDGNFSFTATVQDIYARLDKMGADLSTTNERMAKAEAKLKEFEDEGVPLITEKE